MDFVKGRTVFGLLQLDVYLLFEKKLLQVDVFQVRLQVWEKLAELVVGLRLPNSVLYFVHSIVQLSPLQVDGVLPGQTPVEQLLLPFRVGMSQRVKAQYFVELSPALTAVVVAGLQQALRFLPPWSLLEFV